MTGPLRRMLVLLLASALPVASSVRAQPSTGRAGDAVTIQRYMQALAEQRLLAEETGSAKRLRGLVRRAEQLYFDGRYDRAALLLFEVVESPRFSDFVSLDEFRGAEYMLAGALRRLGALRTASRYLLRILARGPQDAYSGPAFRRYADVALESGDLEGAIEALLRVVDIDTLPEDASNELRYLQGRKHYDAGQMDTAEQHFAAITKKSRFYANAQYLRGVADARSGNLADAEEHFCSIASTEEQDRYSFYVDDRYFEIRDLAWLALGRVAHEGGRSEDAFYYYFQVPQDSERVAEALFESAYAMYEGGDYDVATDLLDQLEANFPRSPFVHEAGILRGYVHLARCEFERANELFETFQRRFDPVVEEIDRVLDNPARRSDFYRELLSAERRSKRGVRGEGGASEPAEQTPPRSTGERLLAMLQVDPTFYRLHAKIRTLDAEAARAGRVGRELGALRARVQGEELRPAAEQAGYDSEAAELRRDISAARAIVAGLTRQLDEMRRAGAPAEDIRPLQTRIRKLGERIDALEHELDERMSEVADEPESTTEGDTLEALLTRDIGNARRLPARVARVRGKLLRAANAAAIEGLQHLRSRLAGELRRARIGRIDAVMGSKRRIEIQIQSLAAGRFPAELQDPLRVQGLLREDEEYWPFEGEYWEDEFQNTARADPDGEGGD